MVSGRAGQILIAACGGHVTCDNPMLAAAVHGLATAELGR